MSTTLAPENLAALRTRLGEKASPMAASVCRLYVPRGDKWAFTGVQGVLALVFDRSVDPVRKSLRVYDFPGLAKVRFEAEIPFDALYTQESEFFHTLEVDDTTLGFCFAMAREKPLTNEQQQGGSTLTSEAKKFFKAVQANKPTLEELAEAEKRVAEEEKKRRPSGWGGAIKAVGGMIFGGKSKPTEVSKPTDFQHKAHLGLSADGTFDIRDIPAEWVDILKAAGVKKKDLKNPEYAKVILNTMSAFKDQVRPQSVAAAQPPVQQQPQQHVEEAAPAASAAATSTPAPEARARSSSQLDVGKKLRAKHPFTATKPTQLTIAKGDTVTVVHQYKNGWTKVEAEDGRVGLVPTNYCVDANGASPGATPGGGAATATKTLKPAAPTPALPDESSVLSSETPPKPTATPTTAGRKPPPKPAAVPPPPARSANAAPAAAAPPPSDEAVDNSAATETDEGQAGARPPPMNAMLAGIQGFKKESLKSAPTSSEGDTSLSGRPSMGGNSLLDGIKNFKKDELKAATPGPAATGGAGAGSEKKPNILDAIKGGDVKLKTVGPPAPKPPPQLDSTSMGIASVLMAKLNDIKLKVQDDDDDDDEGDVGDDEW